MTTYTCPSGHQSADADYCDTCGAPIGSGQVAGAGPADAAAGGSSLDLGSGPVPAPSGRTCPNCSADNLPGALFCEDCGYDFSTGALPPPLIPPDGLAPDPAAPAPDLGTPAMGIPGAQPGAGVPAAASPSSPTPPLSAPQPLPSLASPPPGASGAVPDAGVGNGTPGALGAEWVAELWIDPEWYVSQGAAEPCPSPGPPIVLPLMERSVLIGRHSSSRNIHPQIDCGSDAGVSRRHAQLTTDGQRWWVEDLQSANGTFVGTAGGSLPQSSIAPGLRREVAEDERLYLGAWTRVVIRAALPGE